MLVAVEMDTVLHKIGFKIKEQKQAAGYEVIRYETEQYELIILHCGAGEIAAASGTQYLITAYNVDIVVNFGVAGGLTQEIKTTKVCIVKKVVHYDFDTSAADKNMEAAGIVLTCNRNKIPCLIIKSVSDSIVGGAEEFFENIQAAARICFGIVIKVIENI